MPTIDKPVPKKRYTDRKKETHAIYNTQRWRSLREHKLRDCPICEICNKKLAEEVHHIISFHLIDDQRRREELAYDYNNLQSVCRDCHFEEHRRRREEKKKSKLQINDPQGILK